MQLTPSQRYILSSGHFNSNGAEIQRSACSNYFDWLESVTFSNCHYLMFSYYLDVMPSLSSKYARWRSWGIAGRCLRGGRNLSSCRLLCSGLHLSLLDQSSVAFTLVKERSAIFSDFFSSLIF